MNFALELTLISLAMIYGIVVVSVLVAKVFPSKEEEAE